MANSNDNRLFLYIDLLGFTSLMRDSKKIERIFNILDGATVHQDANYRTIVFSDTILAYNQYTNMSPQAKQIEFMYLVEFVQDIRHRLTGENVFFRAIITEDPFRVKQLGHFQSYYGEALVRAYKDEKKLVGIGLFVDKNLRDLHSVFRYKQFSENYDFVFTTQQISHYEYLPSLEEEAEEIDGTFPISAEYLTDAGLEYLLYPELKYLIEIYDNTLKIVDPYVRAKYLNTWRMYELAYPQLTALIAKQDFELSMISELDWSGPERNFEEDREYCAERCVPDSIRD